MLMRENEQKYSMVKENTQEILRDFVLFVKVGVNGGLLAELGHCTNPLPSVWPD